MWCEVLLVGEDEPRSVQCNTSWQCSMHFAVSLSHFKMGAQNAPKSGIVAPKMRQDIV